MKKVITTIIIFMSIGFAQDVYNDDSTNGLTHPFFGNKTLKTRNDHNVTKKVTIPKNIHTMSADQMSELIKEAKKTAVAYPTDHNVEKYIELQNIATKKSEVFATKWKQAILRNSELDLSAAAPKGTFARNARSFERENRRAAFWEQHVNDIGIVAFFDKDQPSINVAQERVLYFLQKDYPEMAIRIVYVNDHKKLAKKHGVGVTPDIFMVHNQQGKANWYRVKAGMTSKSEVLNNVDFVYNTVILGKMP
jgi:conjugal transfer pilus assembly protein TraF